MQLSGLVQTFTMIAINNTRLFKYRAMNIAKVMHILLAHFLICNINFSNGGNQELIS